MTDRDIQHAEADILLELLLKERPGVKAAAAKESTPTSLAPVPLAPVPLSLFMRAALLESLQGQGLGTGPGQGLASGQGLGEVSASISSVLSSVAASSGKPIYNVTNPTN